MDKKDTERACFLLSLYTEAAAPTNTLLGNPAAMKKMYETRERVWCEASPI
jgi:polyhydroxyalkanoate synthase